ncbi:MAG: hypothetical protein QXM52_05615 [Candidatus Bathyarchaeia archaeon]
MTKFNVTLLWDKDRGPGYDAGSREISFNLSTKEGWLRATFMFRDNQFEFCFIDGINRVKYPQVYAAYVPTQPTNMIDAAKVLLARYINYTGSLHYKILKDLLDLVPKEIGVFKGRGGICFLEPVDYMHYNATLGDIKLQVLVSNVSASFTWFHVYNNVLVGILFQFSFLEGALQTLNDQLRFYKVGSTTVNISKEEAIKIATDRAKNFSWKVGTDPNAIEIKDFIIKNEPVSVELSLWAREPYTLYPHWRITLFLDKVYPGGVTGIQVGIWADTGEVHYIIPLSTGGGPLPEPQPDSSTPSPEPEPEPQQPSSPMEYGYAIIAVTMVAVTASCSYLYIKRKSIRKNTLS